MIEKCLRSQILFNWRKLFLKEYPTISISFLERPFLTNIFTVNNFHLDLKSIEFRVEWGNCRRKMTLFTCTHHNSVNFWNFFWLFFLFDRRISALQVDLKIIIKQLPKIVQSQFFWLLPEVICNYPTWGKCIQQLHNVG